MRACSSDRVEQKQKHLQEEEKSEPKITGQHYCILISISFLVEPTTDHHLLTQCQYLDTLLNYNMAGQLPIPRRLVIQPPSRKLLSPSCPRAPTSSIRRQHRLCRHTQRIRRITCFSQNQIVGVQLHRRPFTLALAQKGVSFRLAVFESCRSRVVPVRSPSDRAEA